MESFISSVITLALVMDAFGNIPLFIGALKKVSPERRKFVLIRELVIAFVIMTSFLFLGRWFLHAFGISEYSLSIAGGILLFLISIDLVFSTDDENAKTSIKEDEPFIVPLAIPLVAGPAALSMVMVLAAQQPNKWIVLAAMVVASIFNSIILMSSFPLSNLLGKRGLMAIERLTGMILILMSVDMIMGGIYAFVKQGFQ